MPKYGGMEPRECHQDHWNLCWSSRSQNDLAPSSGRPERRVDTLFHRGMSIYHYTIDSSGPGDTLGPPYPNIWPVQKKDHIILFEKIQVYIMNDEKVSADGLCSDVASRG